MKYAVAIDIGGTNTRVALIDEELNIVSREQFSTDNKEPEITLNKISDIVKAFDKDITGGRALKFYSSVRLDVRKIETLKQNGEVIGNRTRVKIVKNKVAPPFREAEFDILFGKGISTEGDLVDLASNAGIIQKSGAWFSYEGNKIGQGRENAKQFLLDNPEIREEVDRRVREHYGIVDGVKEAEASDDAKQAKAKKKADTEE